VQLDAIKTLHPGASLWKALQFKPPKAAKYQQRAVQMELLVAEQRARNAVKGFLGRHAAGDGASENAATFQLRIAVQLPTRASDWLLDAASVCWRHCICEQQQLPVCRRHHAYISK
jgi:hypothetical protein